MSECFCFKCRQYCFSFDLKYSIDLLDIKKTFIKMKVVICGKYFVVCNLFVLGVQYKTHFVLFCFWKGIYLKNQEYNWRGGDL